MSGAGPAAGPLLSIGLRRGGELIIWSDRVTSGAENYPLADITEFSIVSAPVTLDVDVTTALPVPALLFRMRDGRAPLFVPSDREAAERVRAIILRIRPALGARQEGPRHSPSIGAAPLARSTPPPPYPAFKSGAAAMSSTKPGDARLDGIAPSDRALAGLAHLSVFYMPLLLPFILWIALRSGSPYASRQAKQAFFFHLLVLIVVAVVVLPVWAGLVVGGLGVATASGPDHLHSGGAAISLLSLICGGGVLMVISVALVASGIYAAVQAFLGKPFHYPLLRRL